MSLERAGVNCRRCFRLGRAYPDDVSAEIRMYYDDYLYEARNEAMKALDEIKIIGLLANIATSVNYFDSQEHTKKMCIAEEALRVCEGCDYSAPKIADLVEKRRRQTG